MKKIINIISWIVFAGGIAGGLYLGCWTMFIQPIIEACQHFDAGTLTGVIVGTTILKCVFSGAVGAVVIYIGTIIAAVLKGISEA